MTFTTTENNAVQYADTGDKCLDLFSKIGAFRHVNKGVIVEKFRVAFEEHPELATRIAFWARAAREGAGERSTFHTILKYFPEDFIADNATIIAELGYWKDLVPYLHIEGVAKSFAFAIRNKDRLACKWAPRKSTVLRDQLGMTNKEYRVWLKDNSETVEQAMSRKQWEAINYSSVPGRAMRTYGQAFNKQDETRFTEWKEDKNAKASVSASYPHDVIKMVFDSEGWGGQAVKDDADWALVQKQWDNLPDFIKEGENILPMADVSGSMSGLPMLVSVSLGMYLANRNKGAFNNTFLTFSERPELVKITGDLQKDVRDVANANWDMNTDFESAYRSILDTGKAFNVKAEDMPTMLLVLSDMQFDECGSKPHLQNIRKEYREAGYPMPKLVFWNLRASTCEGSPAKSDDDGVALVSGFSPVLMKAVLGVEDFNPIDVMIEALKPIEVVTDNIPRVYSHSEKIDEWELEEYEQWN